MLCRRRIVLQWHAPFTHTTHHSAPTAGQMERVSFETLHEAQRISRFAVAAYGLQSVIWAKGQ